MVQTGNPPVVTRDDIVAGLAKLGLSAGDQVMVHSSLKSFGRVEGGPETVIQALMEVVTPNGTLMMPSFNHGKAFASDGPGLFDPSTTPTTNGAIAQAFWQMPDVFRSLHPTHSFAAWGKNARDYIRYHHQTLTCGPESPLGLLGRAGGYGLLLGVDCRANTFHHVVEMTLRTPCLGLRTVALPMRLADGRLVQGRTWGWRQRGCPITDSGCYGGLMDQRRLQRQTQIGHSTATLFRLNDCYTVVAELLTNGLNELPPCSECPIRPARTDRDVTSDWDEANACLTPDSAARLY